MTGLPVVLLLVALFVCGVAPIFRTDQEQQP